MLMRVVFCLLLLPFAYCLLAGRIPPHALDADAKETFASVSQQLGAFESETVKHADVNQLKKVSAGDEKPSDTEPDDGVLLSDSPSMKSKDGFGAMLFLTENERFFIEWERPEPPGIATVEKARRGVPIFTVIILAGMGRDAAGVANVSYDLVIRKPDGSIYSKDQNLIGWRHEDPASPRELQLAEGYVGIVIEEGDPNGIYTVEARVHDHVEDVTINLETEFHVGE